MKILILGAGGVGGYFGAQLIRAGVDITFLLREKRYLAIKQKGLSIITPEEKFIVYPKIILSKELNPKYDLIILSAKSYDLDSAIYAIEKASSKGIILPLLNGMSHLKKLDMLFGADRVIGGLANISAIITPYGEVQRIADRHTLTIGHRSNAHIEKTREFFSLCKDSRFEIIYSNNIEQSMWDKWTFIATLAGLTTLFEANIAEILKISDGVKIITGMYGEACSIADENHYPVAPDVKAKAIGVLTEVGSGLTASMMRDLKQGFRTEHEHILGDLINMTNTRKSKQYLLAAYVNMGIKTNQLNVNYDKS